MLLVVLTHEGTEHELIFRSKREARLARDRLIANDVAMRANWHHGPNMYLIQEEP